MPTGSRNADELHAAGARYRWCHTLDLGQGALMLSRTDYTGRIGVKH